MMLPEARTDEQINRMVARSESRRYVWAYVLSQSVDTPLRFIDVDRGLRSWLGGRWRGGANEHFRALQSLGLVEPVLDSTLDGKPHTKSGHTQWDVIEEALVQNGMQLPFGPIGEQLSLPIPLNNMVSPDPVPQFEPIQLDLF